MPVGRRTVLPEGSRVAVAHPSAEAPVVHPSDPSAAEQAGEQTARDMVRSAPIIDLRDGVRPALRASARAAAPAPSAGCPCGCEEGELLELARAGDPAALHELLGRYRALARTKARSYFLVGADRDDVVQEAMIGLYGAIRDYDEARGVPFRAFAEICVTRQLLTAIRSANRLKHAPLSGAVSLDRSAGADDLGVTLGELVPAATALDPEASVITGDELRALQRHLAEVLTDLERQVLRHHMEGSSYEQIAGLLQRHVKSVDNALQRVKRKLQQHLDDRRTLDSA